MKTNAHFQMAMPYMIISYGYANANGSISQIGNADGIAIDRPGPGGGCIYKN